MNPLADSLVAPLALQDRPLLLLPNGGAVGTTEMHALVGKAAAALADRGVGPGDRVLLQARKSPTVLALYLACLRSGAVFLPLNTGYSPPETEFFLRDSEPALAVIDPALEPDIRPVSDSVGAKLLTLDAGERGTFRQLLDQMPENLRTARRKETDLAAVLYTSGTTGRPKGAMLTHGNLLSNVDALVASWRFTAEDRLLHALPIYHAHGLFVATNVMLRVGGSMLFLPNFDIDSVIASLPRSTAMMGVPTFYTRMLADPRLNKELVRHVRLFISGSAPLRAKIHREFEIRTGHRILERYGMTETGMNTSNPLDGERRPGSVGLPLPGIKVRVADAGTGAELPHGKTRILEVHGPNLFKGYWRLPEMTAGEFREDGYFVTGDLARIEPDGYVRLIGRARDLVITGGLNVYPQEVENEINRIDGILESAVFGISHPDFGEGVVAAAVRLPGAEVTEADILAALDGRLAKFKQPKRVVFPNVLPRNAMGKIQKNLLRTRYAELFAAA